jgi:hypothetical protein
VLIFETTGPFQNTIFVDVISVISIMFGPWLLGLRTSNCTHFEQQVMNDAKVWRKLSVLKPDHYFNVKLKHCTKTEQ